MRIAIIGYGAVAAVHARGLRGNSAATMAVVYGPDASRAEAFAREYGIAHASSDLTSAFSSVDAALVCSPSPAHYEQAAVALEQAVHALVELPACASAGEAAHLASLANANGKALQCAHTSRYLTPYETIGSWLKVGRLGEIRHVHYVRSIPPRRRSWADDALLHHAEHPIDLLLWWFGSLRPLGCAAHPAIPGAQDVSLLAQLPGGAPVSIDISYTTRIATVLMTIAGTEHTVKTDGFSFIESDDVELKWQGDGDKTYERAIQLQDQAFLRACRGDACGISWEETVRLTNYMEEFGNLWKRR